MSSANWKWIFILLGLVMLAFLFIPQCFAAPPETITYNNFWTKLDQPGEIISVVIQENSNKDSGTIIAVKLKDGKSYKANLPLYSHPGLAEKLNQAEQSGLDIRIKPFSSFPWSMLLFLLPLIFLIIWLQKAGKQQTNVFKSFTRSGAKLSENQRKERFSNVAGIDESREEVEDIADFLRNPQKYENLGARIPRGVLLVGPPGCGKTLLARAIAGEAEVPFFSVSGSEFVEMFVGVGAARVRDLFAKAKQYAPSIVFIDEIDAVGRHRGSGLGYSHDEREQTLNQILTEMDGFDERTNIIVLAATNRPDILDPALLRPKRFDRRVVISKPDVKGREAILKVHTAGKPLAGDVRLPEIAKDLAGTTGADLENLVNEAAIIAAKREKIVIDNSCFFEAIDKALMGKSKKLAMDDHQKKIIAFHEVGHAVISKNLKNTDPVRKISIIARESSLGQTLYSPEDRYITSEQFLLNFVSVCLGGRLAEETFLQTKSTGAEDDLRKATEIVQRMVCSWGMSKLGLRVFGGKEEEIFLGREVTRKEDVSQETLKAIDDEVARIIQEAEKIARAILSEKGECANNLAKELLEKETLGQEEIEAICPQLK